VNRHQAESPPSTVRRARIVLVLLAAGTVTVGVWLFIWAWQLGSPVLVLFGVVCLPMGLVLVYAAVLACQGSDAPGAERTLAQRRRARPSWTSDTPRRLSRYEPFQPHQRVTAPARNGRDMTLHHGAFSTATRGTD
jgi:hypothetical protein